MTAYETPREGQRCTFQILFTSDIHGAFRDYNYTLDAPTESGFSKIAALLNRERDAFGGKTFTVDVGDIIQGNATGALVKLDKFGKEYQPYPLLAAFDAAGYDIVSIGNHEFNFGIPALMNAFRGFKGEKLCGNVFDSTKQLLEGFKAYTIRTLDSGLRIAFIGVVSPNIEVWDKANTKGYTAVSAAEATRHIIGHIKARDLADVFVLLGHMHIDNELNRPGSGAWDVAAMNPDIDVFLGAHFHTRVGGREAQNTLMGTVKFAENLDSAKSYGRVRITATFEKGRWHVKRTAGDYGNSDVQTDIIPISACGTVPNDPAVLKATEAAHQFIRKYTKETVVGTLTGGPMVPEETEVPGTNNAILSPTPLMHFIGSIMLHYTGADIASVSLNSYTANCPAGDITLGSIARMYVYDNNTIYTLKMTGKQIKQWMEWSYAFFGTPLNGKPDLTHPAIDFSTDLTIPYGARKVYLHDKFEGMQYEVDLTECVGKRIQNVYVGKGDARKPLDENAEYTVATSNYRATSGLLIHADDGVFPDPGEPAADIVTMDVPSPKGNINMLDWIEEYITEQGGVIHNDCENNWKFEPLAWNAEERERAIRLIKEGVIEYTDTTKAVKISDLPKQEAVFIE